MFSDSSFITLFRIKDILQIYKMAKPSDERNSVISNLRACLISSQGGIRMDSLNKDYMQIIGEYIPFKRLGFNLLEEFLKSIPEISVSRKGSDVYIEAKESQTSAHVTKLVAKQKKTGKKRNRSSRNIPPRNFRTTPRFVKRAYKAPLITTPVYNSQKQCYLPLKISVPQNNNTINYNARIVSEVNRTSNKSNNHLTPVNHSHSGIMNRPSLVSQFSPKNIKPLIPPLMPNGKAPLLPYPESFGKNDMTYRNDASLSPPYNMYSFNGKESSAITPMDQTSHINTPAPPEEPSKKIKQLAQDRLEKVKKNKLLVTVSLQQGESTSHYQRQLTAYLQERGWEEASYKILNENSGKRVCYCTLSIFIPRMAPNLAPEVIDCGTFPNDFYNVNEAKECVAKQALEKLKKREIYNTFPVIHDPSVILQRVERMVKEKDTGKWASKIEDEHRTLFKEILPPHWLNVVSASDQFIVEELANSSLLIKLKENAVPFQIDPVYSTIPKLVLPEENTWDVFVTRAVSVTEVCLRFIGDDYSGLLDSLTGDMESWYQQKEHLVNPFLVVGEYYASYCNESWARVQVLKINIDDIHVKFIDHGDDDVLPRSVLYRLEPKFMSLPPQAITVSLKNLETYKNKEAPDYLLANIVGSCLVAVVEQRTPTISVTLFDTSHEEALNLNEKLKYLFNYNYKEAIKIEEGGVHQASVSYIDESGNVYIQFISETLSILYNQMDYIEDGTYEKYRIKDYTQLFSDKIYLLDQNNEKHRVKIINATSLNGQALVNFIDSGGEDSVFVEDLYNLEEMSYLLSQIPPQAIAITLHEVDPHTFTPEKMTRLKELLLGESVVAKIRKIQNGIPAVEFFKRTVPEYLMVSINQTLILDNELKTVTNRLDHISFKPIPKTEQCVHKNILQQISNNFPSGSIERRIAENRPVLPDIGEEFQILVQQTANPSCIMIQPLDYVNTIHNLEKEMCEFYNNLKSGLDSNIIKEGSLCAVRDKSCWYRAHVDKVIDSEGVSVRLLDYGSLSLVLNTDIKPLKDNFTKVPFVGFCCKISGIAAKHGDWSVEDCLETRVLIDHRKLLAKIKGVHLSQSSLGGTILELQLFDLNNMTGSKMDVGEVLIKKGCAVREERKI